MILKRDETFKVVFNLRTPTPKGDLLVGSGIFVCNGEQKMYMVTANHVAKDCGYTTKVIISDSVGNSTELNLYDFNNKVKWQDHPIADISVLQIQPSYIIQQYLVKRFFPFDHFHIQKTPVSRDCELTSVGFPLGYGASGMFSPLTYRSYASSSFITFNRFDTKTPCEFFLLENPSIGGYSGCPIFDLGYFVGGGTMQINKDKTQCYGIMHGTIYDDTGGKLAAVTPAYYLEDLIK